MVPFLQLVPVCVRTNAVQHDLLKNKTNQNEMFYMEKVALNLYFLTLKKKEEKGDCCVCSYFYYILRVERHSSH